MFLGAFFLGESLAGSGGGWSITAELGLTGLLEDAFSVLLPRSSPLWSSETLIACNTTLFARHDVIKVLLSSNATRMKAQVIQTSADVTSMVCFLLRRRNPLTLLSSRELIPKGSSGGLVIFEDRPNNWDAWDVEFHHLESATSQVRVIAEGPLRVAVQTQVKYGNSTIDVTISLDAITATMKGNSRSCFNFDAVVDWHERHKFLKFELPLNINNTYATHESQFGFVQRPTHKNNAAKFEVCGHKFADLSEYGYGVALLSESKYGFACEGNVLRISLLRAPTAPDAKQDQGRHEFSWAVTPHVGSFLESDVPMAAFIYNSLLHVRTVPEQNASHIVPPLPFWLEGAPNIFLETIKRGEDDFEPNASGTTVILRIEHVPVKRVYVTNILEATKGELGLVSTTGAHSTLKLDFKGFEVKTVKLVLETEESDLDISDISPTM
ncbi:galactose mutarotase-like domain-containing protein [Suillus occidentalis]|nr:galactose mutarotase-like domain-containing protein [Suillus occidentalis]